MERSRNSIEINYQVLDLYSINFFQGHEPVPDLCGFFSKLQNRFLYRDLFFHLHLLRVCYLNTGGFHYIIYLFLKVFKKIKERDN